MKLSKIAKREVVSNLPTWSEAYRNPVSVARTISNAAYINLDDFHNSYGDTVRNMHLLTLNPLEEPFRNWITVQGDITPSGDATKEEVFESADVADIYGMVSGEQVDIITIDNTRGYLYPEPTDFVVQHKLPVSGTNQFVSGITDVSGQLLTYVDLAETASIVEDTSYITLDNVASGEPGMLEIDIPTDFIYGEITESSICSGTTLIEVTGELLISGVAPTGTSICNGDFLSAFTLSDPLIEEASERRTISTAGSRVLLPHHVIGDVVISDIYDINRTITHTISDTGTTYNLDKYKDIYDFNNDGLINEDEYAEMQSNVGKSIGNYNPVDWKKNYDKYDIDQDGTITASDLKIFKNYMFSARNKGSIVTVSGAGIIDITYSYTETAGTSYVYNVDGGPAYLDTKIYGESLTDKPESWKAGAYSDLYSSHLFMDKEQNRVAVVKYATDITEMVIDKFDILLPIYDNDEYPIGIAEHKDKLYTLVKGGVNPYFIIHDLSNNVHDDYVIRYVHNRRNEDESIARDKEGIVNPIGFGVVSKDIIIVIDDIGNGFINYVLIRGIYDYATFDNIQPEDIPGIFTREKYDELYLDEHSISQHYFHIWNRFDDFAFENSIDRIPGEDNIHLKSRLMDYLDNFPNPSRSNIEKSIRREFDLWT